MMRSEVGFIGFKPRLRIRTDQTAHDLNSMILQQRMIKGRLLVHINTVDNSAVSR